MIRATRLRKNRTLPLLFALLCLSLPAHAQVLLRVPDGPYRKWLNEDVIWIITDKERADFKKLSDDKQRDQFVQAFWERRNPTGAPENTSREEHYRRIAYANKQFAAGIVPGWKTDRGRFYIMYGPPDKVTRHLSSDKPRPHGIQRSFFDSEDWHWAYIEGLGCDVVIEFVDTCECGEYQLTSAGNSVSQGEIGPSTLRSFRSSCLIDQILFP